MAYYSTRTGFARSALPFDRSEAGHIARQAAPIAGIALVNMGMSITDTVMAAGLGAEALAGVAIASDLYSILFYLLAGVIAGLGPLYATASARAETDCLCGLRGAGWFVVVVGICLIAPVIWHAPVFLYAIGVESAIVGSASGYIAVMAFVLVPNAAVALYRARLTARERSGLVLRVTLMALPLNALGNWLFTYGIGGWGGLGATGLAISSLLVWTMIAIALATLARRDGDGQGMPRLDFAKVADIVRIGLPIGVMTVAEVGLFLGASIYVGTFSAEAAAAHAIAIRLAGVTYAASIGLNQATTVRIARVPSDSGYQTTIASALGTAGLTGIILCALLLAFATGLPDIVGANSEFGTAAVLAVPAVALLALMECIGPLGATAEGVLRGFRDTGSAMMFSLAGNWLVAAPAILLLTQTFHFGVTGLWAGLAFGTMASSLMMCSRVPRHWNSRVFSFRQDPETC